MEGWNGGRGSSWSGYRRDTVGSNVSSPGSGTIASTLSSAYASSGSPFSVFSMEAAIHLDSLGIHGDVNGNNMDDWEEAEEGETEEERMRSLVEDFFSAPSAKCLIKRGNMSVVERWLKELGVGWIVSLHDGPSAVEEEELHRNARTWIRALHRMTQTIRSTRLLFPDDDFRLGISICVEQGEHLGGNCSMDRHHFTLFIQETILKILTFVDVVVASVPNTTLEFLTMDRVMQLGFNKLSILLGVHKALSSYKILELFNPKTSVLVTRIERAMANLLSKYKSKLVGAMWSAMEETRTKLLDGVSSSSLNLQGSLLELSGTGKMGRARFQQSSDIHNVTRYIITYMDLLEKNYSLVNAAAIQGLVPLNSMIIEMVSSLQKHLVNISELFPDQGLKFLFLLNNTYLLLNSLSSYSLSRLPVDFNHQIENHIARYLQVSWAPLLACLFNPTPLCLGKNYSPLSKFESEFQKIYTTQKQWKVPNPDLRRRLRKAITDNIIPGYTEYIEDNKVTRPKIRPQELEAMLQELFEG